MTRRTAYRRPLPWKSSLALIGLVSSLASGCDATAPSAEVPPQELGAGHAEAVTSPTEEPEVDLPPIPVEEVRGPRGDARAAPILATANPGEGVTVDFIQVDESSMGVAIGGPETSMSLIERVVGELGRSQSPAAFFTAISPSTTPVPQALQAHSDRVVALDNWRPETLDDVPPTQSAASAQSASPPATHRAMDSCGGLLAYGGGDFHVNLGACIDYERSLGEAPTDWYAQDVIAFGSYVRTISGGVFWDIQKRNCKLNACDWYTIYRRSVPQGHVFIYPYSNVTDDHLLYSRATPESQNGRHQHQVSLCRDWPYRVVKLGSTIAGGCALKFQSSRFHCNRQFHQKITQLEKSIIYTPISRQGDGVPWSCN
ncbi:hypothetical protein JY651_30615 [Pyxidicoccus parkwayensis]|uniref:Lipoprotein n=1 Tax=Pyxidicoccus parkwayensis TaxID=2813578 RepID=A0ABX7NLB2_9BACT|nr:hypothetical protein [Pyxidicoccus parkwaysis]QSQ19650.1 hypothetical protein JY651_30615 [Pyxidicoccus parkwaysis]